MERERVTLIDVAIGLHGKTLNSFSYDCPNESIPF